LQLGTTLAYLDEYPAVIPGPFWLKRIVIHAVLAIVYFIGRTLGYQPWLKEYTPERLWGIARVGGDSGRTDSKLR